MAAIRACKTSIRRRAAIVSGSSSERSRSPCLTPLKRGGDPVIFDLADRVELVVVAAGAGDGQAEEGLADGADHVLHLIPRIHHPHPHGRAGSADLVIRPGVQEAGCLDGLRILGPEHVSRKLQASELGVGPVAIEGVDDPVAIAPGVGTELVELESVTLSIASQVEPPPGPSDTVLGRREVAIDDPLVGFARVSFKKASTSSGVGASPSGRS